VTALQDAPPRRALPWWPLAIGAVALLRLLFLDADPAPSMPDPTIMDEALWADSARGALWFPEGWFADDLGNAYLVAPLYTWLLHGIYQLLGIGLWQTRLLSALASIGTAALAGAMVRRRHGHGTAALATLLVGVCPLLDQHGRFALLESTQSFFLLASFALLFAARRAAWQAALAGAAMGAAMLVKPNSATFGALPFALAWLLEWRADVRAARPGVARARLCATAACVAGGATVLLGLGLPVWLAHWDAFTATLQYESGEANWRLGEHLLRLGVAGAREQAPGVQRLSALLRHAPLLALGTWLLLLRRAGGSSLPDWPASRPLWVWFATGMVVQETSYDHVARRLVLLLPAMAILCATAFAQRRAAAAATRPWPALLRWLLLVAPFVLLLKPSLANWLGPAIAALDPSLAAATACRAGGLLVLLLLALLPLLLRRRDPTGWYRRVRAVAPLLLAAAAVSEVVRLSALPPNEWTIVAAQQRMRPLVEAGEVVLGDNAAIVLQTARVRTVRRVIAGARYSSPRPNADVAERLRPRYVLDYKAPALREFADLTASGFEVIGEVGLLRETAGMHRFELQLWRRR
jgi:4-amino-4-deoxy-L-arabinose transferase-like glycosyltransferase